MSWPPRRRTPAVARPLIVPARPEAPRLPIGGTLLPWLALLGLSLLLIVAAEAVPWAFKYPAAWVVPLKGWINDLMGWLRDDASFGLFTFQELTRAISFLIEQPFRLARSLLSSGFLIGIGQDAVQVWPRIPWIALIGVLMLMARYAADPGLALLVGACF